MDSPGRCVSTLRQWRGLARSLAQVILRLLAQQGDLFVEVKGGLKVLMSDPVLVLYEHAFDLSRDDRGVERLWSGFLSLRWLA